MATKLFKRTNDKDVFDTIIEHDDPPAAEDTQAITDSDDSETSKTADSPDDVNRLARESGKHEPLVLTLAYCGLRWGEAVALRVRDVEFLRRRLLTAENAVQLSVDHAVGPTEVVGWMVRRCGRQSQGAEDHAARFAAYLRVVGRVCRGQRPSITANAGA
jgi:hypothetical protein